MRAVKNLPANAGDVRDAGLIYESEDPLEESLVAHCYSCLENSMDRGVWWATVHRVAQSQI